MINKKQANKLRRVIERYTQARIDLSWIGAEQDFDVRDEIQKESLESLQALHAILAEITEGQE